MTTLLFDAAAQSFEDTPTESGLETLVNAILAPLLTDMIRGVAFTVGDLARIRGNDLRLLVTYDSGAIAITHPYLIKGFQAKTIAALDQQITDFITANPSYWISPAFYQNLRSERRATLYVGLIFYNTSITDGAQNWAAGGNGAAPSGVAGGDLSGTYPNPAVKQTSVAFAFNSIISPAALAVSTNDYTPTGLAGANTLRLSSSADVNVTGLTGGASGRFLIVHNVGANTIVFTDEDPASTAANRFALPNSLGISLGPDASVMLQYDVTSARWRAADGTAGDQPGGPAGGDLTGTYPNPTLTPLWQQTTASLASGANTTDSAPIASYGDVIWDYELVKGTVRYVETMRATHDGTNPYFAAVNTVLTAGTTDFTVTVTLTGGNLNLVVTTSSAGWAIRIRRRVLAA